MSGFIALAGYSAGQLLTGRLALIRYSAQGQDAKAVFGLQFFFFDLSGALLFCWRQMGAFAERLEFELQRGVGALQALDFHRGRCFHSVSFRRRASGSSTSCNQTLRYPIGVEAVVVATESEPSPSKTELEATTVVPPMSIAQLSLGPLTSVVNSFNLRSRLFVFRLSFWNMLPSFLLVFSCFWRFSRPTQSVCRLFTLRSLTASVSPGRTACR